MRTTLPAEFLTAALSTAAQTLERDLDTWANDLAQALTRATPEFAEYRARVTPRTLASVRADIMLVCRVMRHEVTPEHLDVPTESLDYARAYVHRGLPLRLLLRVHRLAHQHLWSQWTGLLRDQGHDPETLLALVERSALLLFGVMDTLTSAVVDEYHSESHRWTRSTEAARADLIRGILAGEPTDIDAASKTLGFELRRQITAVVLWTDQEDVGSLERLADELCPQRKLKWRHGTRALSVWAPGNPDFAELTLPAGVYGASGTPGAGLDGFKASHEQAEAVRRLLRRSKRGARRITPHRNVALAVLLSADVSAARTFVASELGALDGDDDNAARVRATLRTFLDELGSFHRAARRLGVHPNTVTYRIRRAEELLDRPVTERRAELEAALMLRELLQSSADPAP